MTHWLIEPLRTFGGEDADVPLHAKTSDPYGWIHEYGPMVASLGVKRLDPRAIIPRYQTAGASGMDLHALDVVSAHADADGNRVRFKLPRVLHVGESILLGTGIAVALPPGHEGQVRGRSSLAAKHGVLATLGTIDVDYRGEIFVQLVAHCLPMSLHEGDRIAQLVVAPVARCAVLEVDSLDATARGAGGLGSTGR